MLVAVGIGARLDIDAVGLEQVRRHRLDARGTVDVDRHATPERPGTEDQIGIADGVIRMKVRGKRDAQVRRLQRGDAALDHRGFRTANHARTEIDEIGRVVHHDRRRRSRSIRIGRRIPGAEQDDSSLPRRCRLGLRPGGRGRREHAGRHDEQHATVATNGLDPHRHILQLLQTVGLNQSRLRESGPRRRPPGSRGGASGGSGTRAHSSSRR